MILRKKLIAGNWKMNKTPAEALALAQEIAAAVGKQPDVDVVICPPFTALTTVAPVLDGTLVKLGAQNMHPEASGAFTGVGSTAPGSSTSSYCPSPSRSNARARF